MMSLVMAFLPDSAMILMIVFLAIALMIGIVSRKAAYGIIGTIILFALLSPFVDSLLDFLPLWLLIILMGIFFLSIGHLVLTRIFGKGVANIFLGHLVWAIFSFPFRLIGRALSRGRRW